MHHQATNIEAALVGINGVDRPVVVLLGGRAKQQAKQPPPAAAAAASSTTTAGAANIPTAHGKQQQPPAGHAQSPAQSTSPSSMTTTAISGEEAECYGFAALCPALLGRARAVVCYGEAGPAIARELQAAGLAAHMPVVLQTDLRESMMHAQNHARAGELFWHWSKR